MKKIPICLTVVLALSSLVSLPFSSGLSTSSVNIASSGTIQPVSLNKPVKSALILYQKWSLTNTEIQFVANHFNLVICGFEMSPVVLQSLKTNNPNMLIFGYADIIASSPSCSYWATANSNENWFLHDVNGNRITSIDYGWYLMDVGSPGWRQFYSSYANGLLKNSPAVDGVFADDVWNQLYLHISWGKLANSSAIPSSAISSWHSNMIGMLQYVEANIVPGKKVIVNTDETTHDYLDVVDGKLEEGYVHATWWELNYFRVRKDQIDAMARDSATGKILVSNNGAIVPDNPDSATLAQVAQNVKYCYAATLLATNGTNCYFTYNNWLSNDGSKGHYPIMDTNLGSPSGPYYQSQSVYMRDFTSGKVLFNPSGNSYNVILGRNYYLMNGTIVSSIVLGSWSGEILLSQV